VVAWWWVKKRYVWIMAKEELFSNPLLSWFITNQGAFPVQRGKADKRALRFAMERLREGGVLLVFPEGTRCPGEPGEPEPGIGYLAERSKAWIVPANYDSSSRTIIFGMPIQYSGYTKADKTPSYQGFAEEVMERIKSLVNQGSPP
jgi:1-acyl-sn-glycerol-3-phosphate acyltransferase